MNNLDLPALPTYELNDQGILDISSDGITKREQACIDLRIPESGDAELDALIRKARRQEFAAKAMQALSSGGLDPVYTAPRAIEYADALLAEQERTNATPTR